MIKNDPENYVTVGMAQEQRRQERFSASPAGPFEMRHEEGGYVEFLNEDVPTVVREIDGRVAILTTLDQPRQVVGYRVYDPGSSPSEVFGSASPAGVVKPLETVRHKKRGTTYEVIGVGKMQAENWRELVGEQQLVEGEEVGTAVDMREVTIYRSTDDGQIWVRPVEEFNDGRFEPARIMSAIEPAGVGVETEPTRAEIDAYLQEACGKGIPYAEATDHASMMHGLAYILRQIEGTSSYKVNIGQTGPATSSLRMALDHFARAALKGDEQ